MMNLVKPDLSKVVELTKYRVAQYVDAAEIDALYKEAKDFLEFYDWCSEIKSSYVGILHPGIVAVFLFNITPSRQEVDNWIWVIVGDIPPAYLTTDMCPNAATALDGYIGAMEDWVEAAQRGQSVENLIPVNVPATKQNAKMLKTRLELLDERILAEYKDDLET